MTRTLLSHGMGASVALVAMALMFTLEVVNVTGRRRPTLLRPATVVVTVALLGLIVARFIKYA